jgi:uncharacterized membrane protein
MEILQLIAHAALTWAETWMTEVTGKSVLNLIVISAVLIVTHIASRTNTETKPWYHDIALLIVSMLCLAAILGAYIVATAKLSL